MGNKMPLSEIRRILERGEWWDYVRDISPDEPCLWLDELNGAIEAALDELQVYHDAEAKCGNMKRCVETRTDVEQRVSKENENGKKEV